MLCSLRVEAVNFSIGRRRNVTEWTIFWTENCMLCFGVKIIFRVIPSLFYYAQKIKVLHMHFEQTIT